MALDTARELALKKLMEKADDAQRKQIEMDLGMHND